MVSFIRCCHRPPKSFEPVQQSSRLAALQAPSLEAGLNIQPKFFTEQQQLNVGGGLYGLLSQGSAVPVMDLPFLPISVDPTVFENQLHAALASAASKRQLPSQENQSLNSARVLNLSDVVSAGNDLGLLDLQSLLQGKATIDSNTVSRESLGTMNDKNGLSNLTIVPSLPIAW